MRYVHTNLIARDWRRLVQFYVDALGCERLSPERDLSGDWLERGTGVKRASLQGIHLRLPGYGKEGPTLEIFQYGRVEDRPAPVANRQGFGHLAFLVEDVRAAAERLVACGGSLVGEIVSREIERAGSLTFVYAADPEGNLIELQHWAGADTADPPESARRAYDRWASSYDDSTNPTRDLDASILRGLLPSLADLDVLELGCGTGKNTVSLLGARAVVAADLSRAMLARLRDKMSARHLSLIRLNLVEGLPLQTDRFHLVTCNLVLEHVKALNPIFREIARVLAPGGRVIVVEYHPYKQLEGKRANFRDPLTGERVRVEAYHHPVSAFTEAARTAGLRLERVGEWLDTGEPSSLLPRATPRLLSLELAKPRRAGSS